MHKEAVSKSDAASSYTTKYQYVCFNVNIPPSFTIDHSPWSMVYGPWTINH